MWHMDFFFLAMWHIYDRCILHSRLLHLESKHPLKAEEMGLFGVEMYIVAIVKSTL